MNKELILKYKDEFDYWLKGGKILMHYGKWVPVTLDAKWEFFISDLEKIGSFGYVIDDEYVELRKALAEGKTIQYYVDGFTGWQDVNSIGNHCIIGKNNYRIKPDEHKFKEGDWVIFNELVGFVYTICKDTLKICVHGNPAISGWYTADKLTPWKPKVGEYCWFWNDGQAIPNLREFERVKGRYQVKDIGLLSDFYGYAYCEPFINDLPTKLKVK